MSDRLPSGVLVSALLRRVGDAGGFATILAKGDSHGGAILVVARDKGINPKLYERVLRPEGKVELAMAGPVEGVAEDELSAYCARRKQRDPDIWIVELDIPSAERFAAETILDG